MSYGGPLLNFELAGVPILCSWSYSLGKAFTRTESKLEGHVNGRVIWSAMRRSNSALRIESWTSWTSSLSLSAIALSFPFDVVWCYLNSDPSVIPTCFPNGGGDRGCADRLLTLMLTRDTTFGLMPRAFMSSLFRCVDGPRRWSQRPPNGYYSTP